MTERLKDCPNGESQHAQHVRLLQCSSRLACSCICHAPMNNQDGAVEPGVAVELRKKLRVRGKSASKHNIRTKAPTRVPRKELQPWRDNATESTSIEETVRRLQEHLTHVALLPPNSAYAKHRKQLLQTALRLAQEQR